MSEWWKELRWSGRDRGWYAKTEDMLVFVPDAVYQHHLQLYLQRIGLEPKTYAELMAEAEEQWQQQCEAISVFQTDLNYWRTVNEPGIQMYFRDDGQPVRRGQLR